MRSNCSLKKPPLTRTLSGAELVEAITREMQLTPEQVPSMAIPILVGPTVKEPLPSCSWRQREPITVRIQRQLIEI